MLAGRAWAGHRGLALIRPWTAPAAPWPSGWRSPWTAP